MTRRLALPGALSASLRFVTSRRYVPVTALPPQAAPVPYFLDMVITMEKSFAPLRSFVKATLTSRFLQVRKHAQDWVLPSGFGVFFPVCWTGSTTMLHLPDGVCPNCHGENVRLEWLEECRDVAKLSSNGAETSQKHIYTRINSLHAVKGYGGGEIGNLCLRDAATRYLLDTPPLDLEVVFPRLSTCRGGSSAGKTHVELSVLERRSLYDPAFRREVLEHLERQVCHHFAGGIRPRDGVHLIHPFPTENE